MAYIQERKDKSGITRYRVQIRLRGFPTTTATFERKTDAKLWAQQTEAEIRQGRYFKTQEAKKHTLGELVDRYIDTVLPRKPKNAAATKAQLLWWKKQIGHCLLSDVSPSLIAEQRDVLLNGTTTRGKKRSPSTVVRYLAALSHAFSICVREWQWLDETPVKRVIKPKEPRGRTRFLSDDERSALMVTCKDSSNPYLYLAFIISISTGMRRAELMHLRWENVDLFKGRILLHETKNNERRAVPLHGLALDLLRSHRTSNGKDIGLLFPSENNPGKPIDLRFSWELALKKAGVRDYKWHDNRHSCASYLLMNGASVAEIAEILGHKSLSMVRRYAHLSETHASNVVQRMNNSIFSSTNQNPRMEVHRELSFG